MESIRTGWRAATLVCIPLSLPPARRQGAPGGALSAQALEQLQKRCLESSESLMRDMLTLAPGAARPGPKSVENPPTASTVSF